MSKETMYKVLWVEDDVTIVEKISLVAEYSHNIILDHYTNWEDAEKTLRKNFYEYSAIILDANCKIKASSQEQEEFITAILPSLMTIFGEKRELLPWYILSAGTMKNFDNTMKGARYQHTKHESEWGGMLYMKDLPDSDEQSSRQLFENIRRVAKDMAMNVVLYRHSEVFAYLGEGCLVDSNARRLMLKMFSALYYPDENIKYEYAGNPLRKVLEYVFRAARDKGLLADECFDKMGHIVLLDASRYMSGLDVNCYEGRKVLYKARWGNPGEGKDGRGGDAVFTPEIANMVKNTLNYSSSDSHTEESREGDGRPFFIDEENKELFFSYLFQVAHIIKWFGKYVELHPNVEENRGKQKRIEI